MCLVGSIREVTDSVRLRKIRLGMLFLAASPWLAVACLGASTATPAPEVIPVSALVSPAQIFTVGDVDPLDPGKKIKRFQPLADYLVDHLGLYGYQTGRVVVTKNMEDMADLLKDGTIDLYMDSPYPTLVVQELSGSQVILRRWKSDVYSSSSTHVATKASGIEKVEDLVGKVVAFEEQFSTAGYVLPAGTLIQQGFNLVEVKTPDAIVEPDQIGYYFSLDEENSVELLLQGRVAAGGMSLQDYERIPDEVKQQLIMFGETITVPRQLVSVRPGLEPQLVEQIRQLMISLDDSEEGRLLLRNMKRSRFDLLPPDSEIALADLRVLMELITE